MIEPSLKQATEQKHIITRPEEISIYLVLCPDTNPSGVSIQQFFGTDIAIQHGGTLIIWFGDKVANIWAPGAWTEVHKLEEVESVYPINYIHSDLYYGSNDQVKEQEEGNE